MRISDWSSDVCSSDLPTNPRPGRSKERFQAMDEITVGTVGVVALFAAILGGVNVLIALGDVGMLGQIGRASCRERVCQYVEISVVAVALKHHNTTPCTPTRPYTPRTRTATRTK